MFKSAFTKATVSFGGLVALAALVGAGFKW
jgi:hypothetical protein